MIRFFISFSHIPYSETMIHPDRSSTAFAQAVPSEDSIFFHFAPERTWMDVQIFGSSCAVVAKEGQGFSDLCRFVVDRDRICCQFPGIILGAGEGMSRSGGQAAQFRQSTAHIFRFRTFFLAEDTDAFAEIFHFADITRPGITDQFFEGLVADGMEMTAGTFVLKVDEMVQKQGDIVFSSAQGRQVQFQHIQPVEQILTKLPFGHCFFQIFVGGGDDPDIYRDDGVITQADDLLFL